MGISGSVLSKILGLPQTGYREWERAHLVVRKGSTYQELDAVQGAMVSVLIGHHLSHDDIRVVMRGVRQELSGTLPAGRIRLICHLQGRNGQLVVGDDDAAVGRAVSTGLSTVVIDVGDTVIRVRDAFRRELEMRAARGPAKPRRRAGEITRG